MNQWGCQCKYIMSTSVKNVVLKVPLEPPNHSTVGVEPEYCSSSCSCCGGRFWDSRRIAQMSLEVFGVSSKRLRRVGVCVNRAISSILIARVMQKC
jgi:hypothetical protein